MNKRAISIILAGAVIVAGGSTLIGNSSNRLTKTVKIENHVLLSAPDVGTVIVTLGANNSAQQKAELLKDFGIKPGDEGLIELTVTNRDIAKEEGFTGDVAAIPNEGSFSSCKVTMLPKGSGIQVDTSNLTMVTGNMLAGALATCGVTDASVYATSPMKVTGQAALTGVMMAFQKATGKVIPQKTKEVANNEITTTTHIAKAVGQKKAETIVNQAKEIVIKDNPNSNIKIENIVNNVVNNNGASKDITPAQKQQLTSLMEQIKGLNLDASTVEKTLGNIESSITSGKKDFTNVSNKLQQEIKENHVAIEKTENVVEKIWHWIKSFFEGGKEAANSSTQQPTAVSQNAPTTSNSSITAEPPIVNTVVPAKDKQILQSMYKIAENEIGQQISGGLTAGGKESLISQINSTIVKELPTLTDNYTKTTVYPNLDPTSNKVNNTSVGIIIGSTAYTVGYRFTH